MEQLPMNTEEKPDVFGTWARRGLSILFGGLFLFEFLNYVHVLSFQVDYTWFGRFFSTLVLFGTLRIIDAVLRKQIGRRLQGTVWILMATLLASDFIGDIFHFYSRWDRYDQLIHFASGALLVASLSLVLRKCAIHLQWKMPALLLYLAALGINVIFAVLYEVEEYLEDYFYGTHRLGDGFDTANDLMVNLIAGLLTIGVALYWSYTKRRKYEQLQNRSIAV